MSDNVFIFGAGFSRDAGIPLLRDFVDRMESLVAYGGIGDKKLDAVDQEVLSRALKVREELEKYHARASFDDRNIEDLLSILTFKRLGDSGPRRRGLEDFNRAIARTIEFCCSVTHPGVRGGSNAKVIETGPNTYRAFWRNLFAQRSAGRGIPSILTFNYDLVLERALLQHLIGTNYDGNERKLPFSTLGIDYGLSEKPEHCWKIDYVSYESWTRGDQLRRQIGTKLTPVAVVDPHSGANIELLKLHGSLNFGMKRTPAKETQEISEVVEYPNIQPPIFNKAFAGASESPWKAAIKRLREARQIVIVGYSLPSTDIYMQYFLKAALGPNSKLSRIVVFDPALYEETEASSALRKRFSDCLAPQFQNRITFRPQEPTNIKGVVPGTTQHFVQLLGSDPDSILF